MIVIEVARGKTKIRRVRPSDVCEAVLMIISLIPIGKVVSYKSVGQLLHIHPRTVANCVKKNPAPIIIPCHRVVHTGGATGGYAFGGRSIKTRILLIEGALIKGPSKIASSRFYDLTWLAK